MQIRVENSRSTPVVWFRSANLRHSFFLSFFLFFFFFLYRVCVRRLLLPFNIYEHFPGRQYKLLLYSLFTFNSTFSLEFRFPFFYSHSPATNSKATKMPGCSFAWKNGRISTGKGVPLISISKPYLTSLGFSSCSLLFRGILSPRGGESKVKSVPEESGIRLFLEI